MERISGRSRDGEGMPENERPARLDEVELALLALERGIAAANLAVSTAEQRRNAA
jgi:hypothetical protein